MALVVLSALPKPIWLVQSLSMWSRRYVLYEGLLLCTSQQEMDIGNYYVYENVILALRSVVRICPALHEATLPCTARGPNYLRFSCIVRICPVLHEATLHVDKYCTLIT